MLSTATPMGTLQVATLPTHDPLMGRMVGSIFMAQQFRQKPEKVIVEGKVDGTDPISLKYERQADGSVAADGFVGSVEIHERFEAAAMSDGSPKSRLFGVAGGGDSSAAVATGHVAGQSDTLAFSVERDSQEVALTDDLKSQGKMEMSLGMKLGSPPTFGGDTVSPYLAPVQYPTPSQPIAYTDHIRSKGKIGATQLSRDMSYTTTTWVVAYNKREGFSYTDMYSAEHAKETLYFTDGKEQTQSAKPFDFTIKDGRAFAEGSLITWAPGEQPVETKVTRAYTTIPAKAAYQVEEQFGDKKMEYVVYPAEI